LKFLISYHAPTSKWQPQTFSHPYADNICGIGAADPACSILGKRKHRTGGAPAYHVLEIMHAFEKSSESGRHITIKSKPAQPKALPQGLVTGRLDP
jgi:hypothetical protein